MMGPFAPSFIFFGEKNSVERKNSVGEKCLAKNNSWRKNYFWQLAVDSWPVAGGGEQVAVDRW